MKTIELDDDLYFFIASQTRHIGESASDILRRLLEQPAHQRVPVAEPVAVAQPSAVATQQGLQALLDQPHTVMVWVSDSQVGGTGQDAAWLPSSTRRRSRGSICGANTCTSSSA